MLDDWVVIAVKKENQTCQKAVHEIKQEVESDSRYIDSLLLTEIDLFSEIE